MNSKECSRDFYVPLLLLVLLAAALASSGCVNAEAAKSQYVTRGEAFLQQKKFQEASIEFRNAVQMDDRLAAAHWGLARADEGLQRWTEAVDEVRRTVELDPGNLSAQVKLGTYLLLDPQHPNESLAEAETTARVVLQKDPNNIEGHILFASVLFT